ncbi:hypothetical protein KIL84_015750 [Mauremys mutica]|uniref:Uncharacterized protein n=1 Tax=Mauremys mutica TaxID=74926 RepID=A0A9D3WTX3_9SAUR|nr:hypothetical protein KIL84_015750 [Mauremys mutica]
MVGEWQCLASYNSGCPCRMRGFIPLQTYTVIPCSKQPAHWSTSLYKKNNMSSMGMERTQLHHIRRKGTYIPSVQICCLQSDPNSTLLTLGFVLESGTFEQKSKVSTS